MRCNEHTFLPRAQKGRKATPKSSEKGQREARHQGLVAGVPVGAFEP
jgi:hypothetical protein